jgi:hypothetical protein
MARNGHGARSDLSPLCAEKQTSAKLIDLNFPVSLELAADRLQQHRVPMEIQELLLDTGEHADVDGSCGIDTHPKKRGAMRDGRNDKRTVSRQVCFVRAFARVGGSGPI